MGVPVITLRGNRHAARVGASILTTLGLERLVAANPAEYVAIAASLASDLDALAALRASLRPRMLSSPLCDGPGFARATEDAFRLRKPPKHWRSGFWMTSRSTRPNACCAICWSVRRAAAWPGTCSLASDTHAAIVMR